MTVTALAAKTGGAVSRSNLANIEAGRVKNVSHAIISAVAEGLGVTPNDLLGKGPLPIRAEQVATILNGREEPSVLVGDLPSFQAFAADQRLLEAHEVTPEEIDYLRHIRVGEPGPPDKQAVTELLFLSRGWKRKQ